MVSAARVAGHRSNRSDFAPKQSAAARSAPRHARADNSAALAAAVSAPGAETAAARADAVEQRRQPRARARAWQAATCGTLGAPVLKASLQAARSHAAGADPPIRGSQSVPDRCGCGGARGGGDGVLGGCDVASSAHCFQNEVAEKARFIDSELP